jgi:urea carboxylase-associated protein 1
MRAPAISRKSALPKFRSSNAVLNETVAAGEAWIREIKAGQVFRIVDLGGRQAAEALFYSAWDTSERYSAQDTILARRNIYLTTGAQLISNLGRPMLTILGDTCGHHDTLGGACAAESNQVRYALDKRNMHNCRDNFLGAIASWRTGLDKRDVSDNISFFMHASITPEGGLLFHGGAPEPGTYVELRAEMDVIAVLSNCPQLNNPANDFNPTPIRVVIWDAPAASEHQA